MKIGIPKEIRAGETRVALIPPMIAGLIRDGHEVLVESGAGVGAGFADTAYQDAGASIIDDAAKLYTNADLIMKVNAPTFNPTTKKHEADLLKNGTTYVGFLMPQENKDAVEKMVRKKITCFAMEFVPRITRAQSMDALSSMATIAGYKAVIIAAEKLSKIFPLLMTAAGSITPANVLILGAGVAGLQAIATAKRLGAKVEAFDPRPAVKEQIESLGASFVEMQLPEEDVETAGGYAKQQSDAFLKAEQDAIGKRLPRMDVVITTAQIFGKRAPILITRAMVEQMQPGAVIIDLAAEQGGNCELTAANEQVEAHGVTVIGVVNLPASVAYHASQMYSKNITNLFKHLYLAPEFILNFEDEITNGACVVRDGAIINDVVKNLVQ
ncbi:Re/Si-specific NAD(P)(+) transhydrogenase subunit alpha [candidate division KSB1 bacterium]|nr:Re/Si-specific NAD(P)(+) transhydrogenase subunit alpha [candidate division KSB1 bacterium]